MRRFTPKDFPWTLDGLKDCIAYNKMKSKIICCTSTAAIVHVDNYDDSIALGAMSDWCISQHVESWHQYVIKNDCIQIFVYDFSKKPDADDSLIGATFNFDTWTDREKLVCSFVRPNYPICELFKTKNDRDALYEHVLRKLFGDFERNFTEFFRKTKGESHKVTDKKVEKNIPEHSDTTQPAPAIPRMTPYTWDDWFYDTLYGY